MRPITLPGTFPPQPSEFPGPYQRPRDLPLGKWSVLANGRIYILTINGVTANNVVEGEFSSGDFERATWDPDTLVLTFYRVLPQLTQKFTGYLLYYDQSDTLWRMAGTFGDARVGDQSGWYATLNR